MTQHVAITYMGYWDVPRIFLARYHGEVFLFDCAFDEDLEDYPDNYKVYILPDLAESELPKDWTTLRLKAIRFLCEVPVARVQFDATRRQSIDAGVLEDLAARKVAG